MTTREENDILVHTGQGTPMGELFRRYWIPALLADELAEADGPPLRVTLLSENLIAFRDTAGNVGLVDEFCAHRRVSLWFGRVEDGGIRCPYHGWKYDHRGTCLEIPSLPGNGAVRAKVKLKSYPCIESGGVIWAYMGPPGDQPAEPNFEWTVLPASHRYINKRHQQCNYLQAMEGGIDGAHVSWLHRSSLDREPMRVGSEGANLQRDAKPDIRVIDSPAGMMIGARRQAGDGRAYWRITPWMMPFYTIVPPYGDHALHSHAWVPIDDENCFAWTMTYHPVRPLTGDELAAMKGGEGINAEQIPGTFRTAANRDNDYLMDRAAQKAGHSYSGVKGIAMQDASLQESAGAIVKREEEFLCLTDKAIVTARRKLIEAAQALAEDGTPPPGLNSADQRIRAASIVRDGAAAMEDVVREVLDAGAEPGTQHMTI